MRCTAAIVLAAQALLTGAVVVMSSWAGTPWLATAGLGLLGASAATAVAAVSSARRERLQRWVAALAWACLAVVLTGVVSARAARATLGTYLDGYYVALASTLAVVILPVSLLLASPALRTRWRLLAMTWFMLGSLLWLGASYLRDQLAAFYLGLLAVVALLALSHVCFRLSTTVIVIVNTAILLLVGLPITDLLVRGAGWVRTHPAPNEHYYLYDVARKDPPGFGRWWNYYLAQWRRTEKQIYMRVPDSVLTYELRPNSHALLMQSPISINSRGFRGPEVSAKRGNVYRIVALGASTTFGVTMNPGDRPWPRLLEELIRDKLHLSRRVEVINAGIPGYRLDQNLRRFETDILPLKPDMVISYHGINGFKMLKDTLPRLVGARPPLYAERPLPLLADVEYRFKLLSFQQQKPWQPPARQAPLSDPLASPYARLYQRLVTLAASNHIRLVLATFSMAVNARSDPEVIRFYQAGYPKTPWQIEANIVHSAIVRQIAAQHPEVILVDTHPHLDGEDDKFIDLVHFAPAGDRQMADTFFTALTPILERDLPRL